MFEKKKKLTEKGDMKEYRKKLALHRVGIAGRYLAIAAVVIVGLLAFFIYEKNRSYTGYDVISTVERNDALNTSYVLYGKNTIKYSRDGISCVNTKNEALWGQTFNMQDPIVDISNQAVVCVDRGGNQIYLFNESGLTGSAETLLPIQQAVVANNGVTAVLLEDSNVSWIYLFDSMGNRLLDARCSLADTGQPLSISLAPDASKLAVSFLQISGGTANTCVVFYNLGSVGNNFVDKIVSSQLFVNELVPRVKYLGASTCVALGEKGFRIFSGAEIPELTKEQEIQEDIRSVVFGQGAFMLICEEETTDDPYRVYCFEANGSEVFSETIDISYIGAVIFDKSIAIYNDENCLIYSRGGKLKFRGTFDDPVQAVFSEGGRKYLLIHSQNSEHIRLS